MSKIRTFVAIHLSDEARQVLGQINQELARQVPRGVRWVAPELMHLTLRFLGDTAVARLPAISQALDAVGAAHAPFQLRLDGLGCFPNRRRPRVIWAGLQGDLDDASALKEAIDAVLVDLGWDPEDRPFSPHLTLGRVKDSRELGGLRWDTAVQPATVPVTAVHLIESQLTPQGSIYTVRHTSTLTAR